MDALKVRRVPASDELAKPADYVFVQKRQPIITVERQPLLPPSSFLKRLWWDAFGKKYELKRIVELLWPERDTVILNCPQCSQPVSGYAKHVTGCSADIGCCRPEQCAGRKQRRRYTASSAVLRTPHSVYPVCCMRDLPRCLCAREVGAAPSEPYSRAADNWLLLAESHLTRRLFGSIVRRIDALAVATG
jgi:hypothetical protein